MRDLILQESLEKGRNGALRRVFHSRDGPPVAVASAAEKPPVATTKSTTEPVVSVAMTFESLSAEMMRSRL